MKNLKDFETKLNQAVSQYDEVVKQNRNLQAELNAAKRELEELKQKPFFPYKMNSGCNTDFGEFILISHAWFTISNLHEQLGIIEVEWKTSGVRKMYLGACASGGKDFKSDVLAIASYGQKIKDSSDVV